MAHDCRGGTQLAYVFGEEDIAVQTRRYRNLAVPLVVVCVLGLAACNQRPARGARVPSNAGGAQVTAAPSPVHPDIPGRTEPCPRAGGLQMSGYPCEPPRPHRVPS
jgi:hypothetical protein